MLTASHALIAYLSMFEMVSNNDNNVMTPSLIPKAGEKVIIDDVGQPLLTNAFKVCSFGLL